MRDPAVGRVLVASLHQAIADLLPTRLAFYEDFLNAEGMREGTIGLAPLNAVLSFLRQEGPVYDRIAARAGEYAAEWTALAMSPVHRAIVKAAPSWARSRWLLVVAGRLVRRTHQGSRAVSRVRGGMASVDLHASVFCAVRETASHPLCGFYAAAFARLLVLFGLPARAEVAACRGTGAGHCRLSIALVENRTARRIEAA
jgi:bacteriochlorophyll 4-vinyl reductase